MPRYQCQICGLQSNVKSKQMSPGKCKHEWEVLSCEKPFIKWYWRCKFCGVYPTGNGNANGLAFPSDNKCQAAGREGLYCVWERLLPENSYNKNNWVCRKCNKTAGQLGVGQAQKGYNVPGFNHCFENKPTNHIWKRIK